MKILKAKLKHNDGFSNSPSLQVLIDKFPEDLVYQRKGSLYFAEKEGFVRFYYYDRPGDGYAGRSFTIKVEEDTGIKERTLKGPWSSSCSCMNAKFPHSMEVSIIDNEEAYERGFTFYSGALTIHRVKEALRKIQGASLVKETARDSVYYTPIKMSYNHTHEYEFVSLIPTPHILYTDADENIPEAITDTNGQVVLSLCKVCGKAEIELDGECHE